VFAECSFRLHWRRRACLPVCACSCAASPTSVRSGIACCVRRVLSSCPSYNLFIDNSLAFLSASVMISQASSASAAAAANASGLGASADERLSGSGRVMAASQSSMEPIDDSDGAVRDELVAVALAQDEAVSRLPFAGRCAFIHLYSDATLFA
jgi:hypothetical protein